MKKNQLGFGVVEIFLIVIIVGLVGFVGWYVWNANQKTNESLTSASNASDARIEKSDKTTNKDEYKIPDGWVEYKNESIGFSFAYPKEWGQVTVGEDMDKRRVISFTTVDGNYGVRLHSKDAPQIDADFYTSNVVGLSFDDGVPILHSASWPDEKIGNDEILFQNKDSIVRLIDGNGGPPNKSVVGLKAISLKDYHVAIFGTRQIVEDEVPETLELNKQFMAGFKEL